MDELGIQQRRQTRGSLLGRILQGFQQNWNNGLNFRIADDRSDDLQSLSSGRLHFDVAVAQYFDQFGYNSGQT